MNDGAASLSDFYGHPGNPDGMTNQRHVAPSPHPSPSPSTPAASPLLEARDALTSGSRSTLSNGCPLAPLTASRESIVLAYAAHYRNLLSEQHRFSDTGREQINDTLEQLQSLLGIRPLDLAIPSATHQPRLHHEGERLGTATSALTASSSRSFQAAGPYQLRPVNDIWTPPSNGARTEERSPDPPSKAKATQGRHLFPTSSRSK